ncbi:MAG: type II secretion system protein [Desulfobacteraceae bacterium]|jgi:prepilin-type N-terminal cleavage/methylation domain-containing protein
MLLLPQKTKEKHLDEAGFTLLEIIAVIVILSIIAVVAVPRYFDLQQQAREKTIKTGLAEAIGRVNGHFAEALLAGSLPWQIDLRADVLGADMGDFTLYTSDGAEAGSDEDNVSANFRIWVEGSGPLRGMSAGTQLPRPGL